MTGHDDDGHGAPPAAPGGHADDDAEADRAFGVGLLGAASVDVAPGGMHERLVRELSGRMARREQRGGWVWARRAGVAAAALGALAAGALLVRWRVRAAVDIVADAPLASGAPASLGVPASSAALLACPRPPLASGKEPTIDDFEDGVPRDGGATTTWHVAKDSDPPGTSYPVLPSLRPQAAPDNRFALHVRGDELRDWGASIEIKLAEPCYDASGYAGIAFSARGPGRVYLAVREVRVVGVEYGGTCTHDCYNAHVRKIDLDPGWRRFEVPWTDLRERGYQMPPLDPSSLHSVTFQVHAEDTPYDVWIDDVELLAR